MLQTVKQFIHSDNFWRWHGFILSIFWLLGSAIGIALKKRNVTYHVVIFVIIDYISLFFMASAIYLILPKLDQYWGWSFAQKLHIVGGKIYLYVGLLFLLVLIYQHVSGALSWYKVQTNPKHRKRGTKLAIFGRILAGIGWMIHQSDRNYAIAVFAGSLLMYAMVERTSWAIIKTN